MDKYTQGDSRLTDEILRVLIGEYKCKNAKKNIKIKFLKKWCTFSLQGYDDGIIKVRTEFLSLIIEVNKIQFISIIFQNFI